jgi:hypothetical protein
MGAKSKSDIIQELFTALSEIPDFQYSVEELYELLGQTDYKIPKKGTKLYPSTAWGKFMSEKKKSSKSMTDSKEIGAQWEIIKNAEDQTEFQKYQKLANDENVLKGLPLNPDGTVIKSTSMPLNKKLRLQLIQERLKQKKVDGEDNNDESTKPIYSGKGVKWVSENYKQWKLNELGKNPTDTIPRAELKQFHVDDSYTKESYDESKPWYQYIKTNMAYCSDH